MGKKKGKGKGKSKGKAKEAKPYKPIYADFADIEENILKVTDEMEKKKEFINLKLKLRATSKAPSFEHKFFPTATIGSVRRVIEERHGRMENLRLFTPGCAQELKDPPSTLIKQVKLGEGQEKILFYNFDIPSSWRSPHAGGGKHMLLQPNLTGTKTGGLSDSDDDNSDMLYTRYMRYGI